MRGAEILKIRLKCLNYSGGNMEQFRYGTACELNGQRYKEFTELLLDKYKPDIVFTHWPIDVHMDHRAASLLTYTAWLHSGKKFPLYYMEADLGTQTQNFFPTHYIDITAGSSARMRHGRRSVCGTTTSGLFMTGCGECEERNTAAR
jgi:LmbE family N-acetylglucosaminyl deacetylase